MVNLIYKHRLTIRRLLIASSLGIIGLAIFLWIYDGTREHGDLARLDQPTLAWVVAHRTPGLTYFMELITNIFSPVKLGLIITIAASVWAWRSKELWRPSLLIGSMAGAFVLSSTIKGLTTRMRPPIIDMVPPLEIDYSFPSGHTLGIAVCLLVAGYLVCSRSPRPRLIMSWAIITVLGVTLIAFSRLYLAYHWITDVSASVAIALVVLAIVMLIDPLIPRRITTKENASTRQ